MPALVDGEVGKCTLGETVQAMADIYGRHLRPLHQRPRVVIERIATDNSFPPVRKLSNDGLGS
ncbi:MAG: hypothetical protein ACYTGT_20410 [Planctomycetota bacterium]|jgi:hypothetical protein